MGWLLRPRSVNGLDYIAIGQCIMKIGLTLQWRKGKASIFFFPVSTVPYSTGQPAVLKFPSLNRNICEGNILYAWKCLHWRLWDSWSTAVIHLIPDNIWEKLMYYWRELGGAQRLILGIRLKCNLLWLLESIQKLWKIHISDTLLNNFLQLKQPNFWISIFGQGGSYKVA